MLQNPYQNLNDQQLVESLQSLAHQERATSADNILRLIEVKTRKLFVPAGYATLFEYCTRKLGFSKSSAYRRTTVAAKAAEFPEMIDRLKDGRLHLCAAAVLVKYLAHDTATELLDAVIGMSKNDVEHFIVKTWEPKLRRAEHQAKPAPNTEELEFAPVLELMTKPKSTEASPDTKASTPTRKARPRTDIKPLSETTNRVSITMSDETVDRLKRAREVLGAKSDDEILRQALDKLLDQVAPERRHARREKKAAQRNASKAPKGQETIDGEPATQINAELTRDGSISGDSGGQAVDRKWRSVKSREKDRTVHRKLREAAGATSRKGRRKDRDLAFVEANCSCSYVAKDGTKCQAKAFIEIDHVKPWSLGGTSVAANFRPLCRTHHAYYSERSFGHWCSEVRRGDSQRWKVRPSFDGGTKFSLKT